MANAPGSDRKPFSGSLAEMQGHTFAGGTWSRSVFATLLGLKSAEDAAPGELRIAACAWVKDRVELTVDTGPETPPFVVVLERFHPGRGGLTHSARLNVYSRNDGLPNDLVRVLQRSMQGRLGGLSAEGLAKVFAKDPELGSSRYEAPPVVAESREREFDRMAFLFNWGGEDMWYQFFATAELSRARLESLDLLNRATSVNHCDRECLANEPHIPLRVPLTNFPWDDRVRRTAGGRQGLAPTDAPETADESDVPGLPALPASDGGHVDGRPGPPPWGECGDAGNRPIAAHYTELTDYDVIMGGQKKLAQVLDFAIEHLHGDMIFAHVTCIPAVTGEDVDSVIRKAQEKSPVPILTLTMTPDAKDVIFGPILVEARKAAEASGLPVVPHTVNLIGFPEDNGTSELQGLLGALGVRVNVILLPTVQLERVKRLPLAPLHVIQPNGFWENLYNQLLFDTSIRAITPEGPFGYARTVAWLRTVAREAGRTEAPVDEVVRTAWAPHAARWEALREEARQHRLGFVLDAEQVHQIATPGATWGIPMLGVLEEAGFAFDFMIHATEEKAGRTAAKEVQGALGDPKRHRMRLFQTPSQLAMLLQSGPFSAIYSEHFFDFRVTRSGKSLFSLNVFERGFGGAVRTVERMLDICRLPLYRRYGRYLGPAFPWANDADVLASLEKGRSAPGGDRAEGGR